MLEPSSLSGLFFYFCGMSEANEFGETVQNLTTERCNVLTKVISRTKLLNTDFINRKFFLPGLVPCTRNPVD